MKRLLLFFLFLHLCLAAHVQNIIRRTAHYEGVQLPSTAGVGAPDTIPFLVSVWADFYSITTHPPDTVFLSLVTDKGRIDFWVLAVWNIIIDIGGEGDSLRVQGKAYPDTLLSLRPGNFNLTIDFSRTPETVYRMAVHGVSLSRLAQSQGAAGRRAPPDFEAVIPGKTASVFPNPAADWIFVRAATPIVEAALVDIGGRIVSKTKGNGTNNLQLSVLSLPPATYLLRVSTSRGEETHKIIKQ